MSRMIKTRRLNTIDIESIVDLHYDSFKEFFLTSLGKPFLKIFYNTVISHGDGFGFGAFDNDGNLIGFAIGTNNSSGFYSSILKKNSLKMIYASFSKLAFNPGNVKRLLNSLFSSSSSEFRNVPSLLSICVSNQHESKGIGRMILIEFENDLRQRGYKELILTTDTHQNEYVNQFYVRNNYALNKSFFQGNRQMNLYHKKL